MGCSPIGLTGDKLPAPVGTVESTIPERFYLGCAAPGPGRARRAAPRRRDAGGSREDNLPTGLLAPASDGLSMSYHRPIYIAQPIALAR